MSTCYRVGQQLSSDFFNDAKNRVQDPRLPRLPAISGNKPVCVNLALGVCGAGSSAYIMSVLAKKDQVPQKIGRIGFD
jgi:hypothetical protein